MVVVAPATGMPIQPGLTVRTLNWNRNNNTEPMRLLIGHS